MTTAELENTLNRINMASQEPATQLPSPFWDQDDVAHARFRPETFKTKMIPRARTVLERTLDQFTATIRQKPRWWEKVFRNEIVQRWESEASEQDVDSKTFSFALQVILLLHTSTGTRISTSSTSAG